MELNSDLINGLSWAVGFTSFAVQNLVRHRRELAEERAEVQQRELQRIREQELARQKERQFRSNLVYTMFYWEINRITKRRSSENSLENLIEDSFGNNKIKKYNNELYPLNCKRYREF